MSASLQDIMRWLAEAKEKDKCTHMIVARDTFDYDNYPVFVYSHEDIHKCIEVLESEDMTTIDEVYNMSMGLPEQLRATRVYNT